MLKTKLDNFQVAFLGEIYLPKYSMVNYNASFNRISDSFTTLFYFKTYNASDTDAIAYTIHIIKLQSKNIITLARSNPTIRCRY